MKKRFIMLAIVAFALSMGCAVDSRKTEKKTEKISDVTPPAFALDHQVVDRSERPELTDAPADNTGGHGDDDWDKHRDNSDSHADGDATGDDAPVETVSDQLQRTLGDLKATDLVLNAPNVIDLISIELNSGQVINVDRAAQSTYFVRAQLPPDRPMLLIDRVTNGQRFKREYELRNPYSPGDQTNSLAFQTDGDFKHHEFDYGEEGGRYQILPDSNGDLKTKRTYTKEPLFKKIIENNASYDVSLIEGQWKVSFTDTRKSILKQLRAEDPTAEGEPTERQKVEQFYKVNFDQMAAELFNNVLSSSEVKSVLSEMGLGELRAQDVAYIRNYISIQTAAEVADITVESHLD